MMFATLYRNNKWFDLIVVNLIATIAVILVVIGIESVVLRTIVGVPLVLGIPGYLLFNLLTSSSETIQLSELPMYAGGLSIAIVAVTGLLLAVSPWGIQAKSFVMTLGMFTYVTSAFIYVKRSTNFEPRHIGTSGAIRPNKSQYLILIYAVIIMGGALIVSYMGANQARQTNFTEFWIVPTDKTADKSIAIGIRNVEHSDVVYDIQLKSKDTVIQEWKSITLKPSESWSRNITIGSDVENLEALLYREDNPEAVYRRVTLELPH